jgi:hypothetical protein
MDKKMVVDESKVSILAEVAGLPLGEEREANIAPPLSQWLADANELNRKMSEGKFWEVAPTTVFRHSSTLGGGSSHDEKK